MEMNKQGVASGSLFGSFFKSKKGSRASKKIGTEEGSVVSTSGKPMDISFSSVGNFSLNS